jgi:hypothetical protein
MGGDFDESRWHGFAERHISDPCAGAADSMTSDCDNLRAGVSVKSTGHFAIGV